MATTIPNGLTSQNIKKQVTVTAGTTQVVQIPIPNGATCFVEQYGYDYFASTTYRLNVTGMAMPARSDQEGSIAQPRVLGQPIPCKAGQPIELHITNGDATDHTYQFMVVLLTDRLLEIQSEGGAITQAISGASGSGQNVVIYDSTVTNAAPVTTTFGLGVDPKPPTALQAESKATTSAAAVQFSSAALRRGMVVRNNSAVNALVGPVGNEVFPLAAGETIAVEISNANLFSFKRVTTDVTLVYLGD